MPIVKHQDERDAKRRLFFSAKKKKLNIHDIRHDYKKICLDPPFVKSVVERIGGLQVRK